MSKKEILAVDFSDSEDDDGLVYSYDTPKTKNTFYMNSSTESGREYPSNNNLDPQKITNNHISPNNNETDSRSYSWNYHRRTVTQEKELESTILEDLRIAIQQGKLNFVKQALQQGFGVDTVLKCGWTCLMNAASYGRPAIIQLLLSHGANPNFNKEMVTPLMAVCMSKSDNEEDLMSCAQQLIDHGARVNDRDRYHVTPLMLAAREGHCQLISCLLTHNANLNAQDNQGWTALCWTAKQGHGRAARILMDAGADTLITASTGQRAVDIAFYHGHNEMADILQRHSKDKSCSLEPLNGLKYLRAEWMVPGKSDVVKFEDLELFLCGLGFMELVPLFREQQVTFHDLLLITDQDLIQMGVTKLGMRKRILEQVKSIHKSKWSNASLVDLRQKKDFTCLDVVAAMRNINKHFLYIQSSILYMHRQLKAEPQHLEYGKEVTSVKHLLQEVEQGMITSQNLHKDLQKLQQGLSKVQTDTKYLPVDTVEIPSRSGAGILRSLLVTTLLGGLAIAWKVRASWLTLLRLRLPSLFPS